MKSPKLLNKILSTLDKQKPTSRFFVCPLIISHKSVGPKFWPFFQVISVTSENDLSRKSGLWNWLCQPLVHTVMCRTCALRALVLAHNCMNSWLAKPISGFSTSWKRYILFFFFLVGKNQGYFNICGRKNL